MAADLKFTGIAHRSSIVLLDDHLVVLKHGSTRDRVRRVVYDRIDSVLSWRSLPWVRMVLFGVLFGISGLLMLAAAEPFANVLGAILLSTTTLIEVRYLYMGKTTLRITRADKHYDFTGVVSPRKVASCLSRLDRDIRLAQQRAEEKILARLAEDEQA
jgi:hypothetical protein